MSVVESLVNLFFSITLVVVFKWGLIGIAAGTLISNLLFQSIIVPYHACKKAGFSYLGIVFKIGVKALAVGGLFLLICFFVQKLFFPDSWILFLIQVIMSVIVYIPFAWFILVPTKDRIRFRTKVLNLF